MQALADRQEMYRAFNELIHQETRRERSHFNRRMMSVLVWSFIVPTTLSFALLFLVKSGVVPRSSRVYAGWLILLFPVSYALYFLVLETIKDAPKLLKRGGGTAMNLGQFVREAEWRGRFCAQLSKELVIKKEDWHWIVANFKIDLEMMRARTRYITSLAGAVFFLIMQGIDSIMETDQPQGYLHHPSLGWIDVAGWNLPQFVGLALFLLLLYLSGSQTYQGLLRFLGCAELVLLEMETKSKP